MKKLLIKLVLLVTVLLTVPYYFLGGSLPLPGFLQGMFSGASVKKESLNTSTVRTDRDITVYKWVDDKGRTHFGEKPPVGEVAETIELKTDSNLMKAVKNRETKQEDSNFGSKIISLGESSDIEPDTGSGAIDMDSIGNLKNPYSPEGVKDLFESAKTVRDMVNKRQGQQQNIFDGSSVK